MPTFKAGEVQVDDDGRPKRTGTVWTASAHIITTMVGAGVLSLSWSMAQLGWIGGSIALLSFCFISIYTCGLLADSYRDPITGKRNHRYKDAVKNFLGNSHYIALAVIQYSHLCGLVVNYTVTAAISMVAVSKSNCFHKEGRDSPCLSSNNPYMIAIGITEIFVSQVPNFHKLWWLSTLATIMSFSYAGIGMGLSFAKIFMGKGRPTTLTGVQIRVDVTSKEKIWRIFRAIGDIALSYSYSTVLIEIEDTIRSSEPENKVMRKANLSSIIVAAILYMLCGGSGYAALGNKAPGNILTGFGFYEPFWLIDLANICIVIHLIAAYQVGAQPVYELVETWAKSKWPKSKFVNEEYPIRFPKTKFIIINLNMFRIVWRSGFVVVATLVSMVIPFFNAILALLSGSSYWPLVVYFPLEMYIAREKIRRGSTKWCALQLLNLVCFLAGLAVTVSAIEGFVSGLRTYKPFMSKY